MNQDFGLSLTPANARRLLRFQDTFDITISDDLRHVAQQSPVTANDFDQFMCKHDRSRHGVTQFLLDCGMRGIVQQYYHPSFDETALMNAVRLSKVSQITVVAANRSGFWRNVARYFFLDKNIEVHQTLSPDILDRRTGVLIYNVALHDRALLQKPIRNFAAEFAKVIIFESQREWSNLIPWPLWASILFPTMPTPMYARLVANGPKGWCNVPLHRFAPFYNVCLLPELIDAPHIQATLTDDALSRRLTEYRPEI